MRLLSNNWLSKRGAPPLPAPISVAPSRDFDGNDGPWSSFPIQIGTPPQTVKVLISTATSQTWVIVPEGCTQSDPANCSISRGGLFQNSSSSTWKQNQDVAHGLAPLPLAADLHAHGTGLYGYDTVSLGAQGANGPTLDQQVVAGVPTKDFYLGLFGLNPQPVNLPNTSASLPDYVSTLNQSGLIPSLSWSYTAGNQYRPGPVYGSLVLGGYDTSRFEPNDLSFTFNHTDSRNLSVNIGAIFLTTNDLITDISTANESISAFIDSTTPYIWLPLNICQQFEEAFGITFDEGVQAYLVNDTLHNALQDQGTSVVFNIGNSTTIPGQGLNISLPYGAFDLVAEPPLFKNSSRYFPLMRATNESQYTLGRTFLQEAYLIADYERNNFSISQCRWDSGASSHIVAIKRPGDDKPAESHKLSAGAIAGIAIGAAILLVAVAVLLGIILKRRRRPGTRKQPMHINIAPIELDAPEKDGYMASPRDFKGNPQSPELDGAIHKGHELAGHADSQPEAGANQQRYELAATERGSQTLSSPISLLSERSDATKLHQRQLSDPVSLTSEVSDSAREDRRNQSDPVSPMRQRSDATRLHRRELSEPTSVASEGPHATPGHESQLSQPISPPRARSDAARGHRRGLSDPVSVFSEMLDK